MSGDALYWEHRTRNFENQTIGSGPEFVAISDLRLSSDFFIWRRSDRKETRVKETGDIMHDQAETVNILSAMAKLQSPQEYQELNWEGSFEDYLKLIQENPRATRNAFQRIYDMLLSHG